MIPPGQITWHIARQISDFVIWTGALSRSADRPMTGIVVEVLEPYEWKLSCTVLRGERGCKVPDLPG